MNLGEFYSTHTHANKVTGCVIWDGEISRNIPVFYVSTMLNVRKFIYESIHGQQPYRTKFESSCENSRCVKYEHIVLISPEQRPRDYPEDKVAEAWKLYQVEGLRQDKIAEKMGIDPSTVSKYIKQAKATLEQIANHGVVQGELDTESLK